MTQKPLHEMTAELVEHFNNYSPMLEFNHRLYKILEGQIRHEVEESLRREVIDHSAYRRVIERIPPVNILRKASEKLSKVYVQPPVRRAEKKSDQAIIDDVVRSSGLDASLATANLIFNAMRSFALEPYVDPFGQHRFRVLAPHQFLPYSDDPTDPRRMTVFMKFMGREDKIIQARYDERGNVISEERIQEVDIFAVYSDTEFLVMDSAGGIREEKMAEMGGADGVNPFERIPFIYRSKSKLELIPFPNQEGFDITVLIPKLLADLNYSAQFMNHSIIWTKNADLQGQSINPDCIVDLGDSEQDGKDPQIGTITPDVNISGILEMVQFQLNAYFTSIGIRAEKTSGMTNGRDVSGIAKAIDEADVSAEQKSQMEMFRGVERDLWELFSMMQIQWVFDGATKEARLFSDSFIENFQVLFGEVKVNKSVKQVIEETKELVAMGLIGKLRALKMIYPEISEAELKKWLKEADSETEMPELPDPNGGQFAEGNDVGANQDTDSQRTDTQ